MNPPAVGSRLRNTRSGTVYVVTKHLRTHHLQYPEVLLRLAVLAADGDPTGSTVTLASGHVTHPGFGMVGVYVPAPTDAMTVPRPMACGRTVGPSLTAKTRTLSN